MRILQLNTNFRPGGIQRHILDLSDWLRVRGHDLHLGGTPGPWASVEKSKNFVALPVLDVSWEGGNPIRRGGALIRAAWGLRRYVKKHGIELVHSHESAPAMVARIGLAGLGVRQVVTYHGSAPDRVIQYARISSRADMVITPSHASATDLAEIGGLNPERLKVIGLGLRPPLEANENDIANLRKDLLSDGSQLVVLIARIAYQKGIDVLIECVKKLKVSHPHIRFALVGPGPDETAMKALAKSEGVTSHLTFVGATTRHTITCAPQIFSC